MLWAAEGRHAFDAGEGSIEDVERRITSAGLQLCTKFDDPEGTANQAVRSRQYVVAEDCGDDTGELAVDEFEDDPLATEVFGAELHATYARVRRDEWREYNTVVGEWERERYLHLW